MSEIHFNDNPVVISFIYYQKLQGQNSSFVIISIGLVNDNINPSTQNPRD